MKKKLFFIAVIVVLAVFKLFDMAFADIPKGFWQYVDPYLKAVEENNAEKIIEYGKAIEKVFENSPLDSDKLAVLNPKYKNMSDAYLSLGDYDSAVVYLKKHIEFSKLMNETDNVINAEALLNHIDLNVDVYALTQNKGDLPFYNAKNEPEIGTYYGRILGSTADNETAIIVYAEFFKEEFSQFDYLISPEVQKNRVIELAWNFPNENNDLPNILSSNADAYIRRNLEYISKINSPVLLRIGAEMNVWTNLADPDNFKNAFIKIAKMAREIAPNAALVFSPNYVSNRTVTIMDYYPGDQWVDWVGVSLYGHKYSNAGLATLTPDPDYLQAFYGTGDYTNPIAMLNELVKDFGDRKPIMISEGGSGHTAKINNADLSEHAASYINMMYSYINMVYPQVKCIIYFDNPKEQVSENYIYYLKNNQVANTAYNQATANNKALRNFGDAQNYGYTKLSQYEDTLDTIRLGTYAVFIGNKPVTVEYYLNDKLLSKATKAPYYIDIDTDSLNIGQNYLKVTVNGPNNYKKTLDYSLFKGKNGIVSAKKYESSVDTVNVKRTSSNVMVDSKAIQFKSYNIGGNNFFMLRDIAYVLNGTSKEFEIKWDGEKNAISIITNSGYTSVGTEMITDGSDGSLIGRKTRSNIYLDGKKVDLLAYNINGSNYFKLRDLGMLIDFGVEWNQSKNLIEILSNNIYMPE